MADTSMVDLVGLIERVAPVRFSKPVGTGSKRAQKAACPFCKMGTDRFAVFVGESPQHYYCGVHGTGCGAHGDAITFLREYSGMSYQDACDELGIDSGSYASPRASVASAEQDDKAPNATWQKKGVALAREAAGYLWSDCETAHKALAYLRKRGLTDETIKSAKLGYLAAERYEERTDWGMPVQDDKHALYIPRGWVIPWLIEKNLWRVDIRRHPKDLQELAKAGKRAGKYHRLSGSGGGLYGADAIKPGYPLCIVESPLDALSGAQVSSRAVWVATGSTGGARSAQWAEAMAVASPVLVAFDQDDNGAGSQAFKYWRNSTLQSYRCLPWAHDINDMLTANIDIDAWLSDGLETAQLLLLETNAPETTIAEPARNMTAQNERELSDNQQVEPVADPSPRREPPGYERGNICLSCGVQVEDKEGTFYVVEDRMSDLWGEIFCMSCWLAGYHAPCGQYHDDAQSSQSAHTEALSQSTKEHAQAFAESFDFDGTCVMVHSGMSPHEYIEHWYAREQEKKLALASESPQDTFWRGVHERLQASGYYEQRARDRVLQQERIRAYRETWLS